MGLDSNGVRFLIFAREAGVNFSRCAMIGRQGLFASRSELEQRLREFSLPFDEAIVAKILSANGYAEELLKYLGATEIHSFDHSNYEQATHLHDMNREIPASYHEQYSVVLDGGSLEHVFNFPQAIKNCMEMVEVGGHYLAITPGNNFLGHGFYQFSPELFFSVFTPENGYEMVDLIAFESTPGSKWYSVNSPSSVQDRITLRNNVPVYLLLIAKKTKATKIFESAPQQSDYVSAWNCAAAGQEIKWPSRTPASLLNPLLKVIPLRARRAGKELLAPKRSFDPRFFVPICPLKRAQELKK